MTRRLLGTLFVVSALAVHLSGFQQTELLTNASIVKMVTDKIPAATITSKIESTPNGFDVSASALVELFQKRVPADVISAMLKAQSKTPTIDNADVLSMIAARLPSKLILEKIARSPTAFDMSPRGRVTLTRSVPAEILRVMNDATPKGGPPTPPAAVASVTAPTNPPNTAGAPTTVAATEPKATPLPRPGTPAATPVAPTPVAAVSIAKVGDGEAAVFTTALNDIDAGARVMSYFRSRNIDLTLTLDRRMSTGWFNERSCGPALLRCSNRAVVRVGFENGRTTVTVQVFERSRQAVPNPKPWTENTKSSGKETSEMAIALQTFVK